VQTSALTRQGDAILLRRSRAFLVILLVLVAVRLAARSYVEKYVDTVQTGSLFFLLAYGMLLPWRVVMFLRYRALVAAGQAGSELQTSGGALDQGAESSSGAL
jgi:membrane protein CcdC involved in cytochrome C biogenesis